MAIINSYSDLENYLNSPILGDGDFAKKEIYDYIVNSVTTTSASLVAGRNLSLGEAINMKKAIEYSKRDMSDGITPDHIVQLSMEQIKAYIIQSELKQIKNQRQNENELK